MSTISLPHEKQIRHFFIADALATETTISTFISGASIGEVQIFGIDGKAAVAGKDFYIAKKNNKGGISKSDFVTPKDVTYLKGTAPRAKVGKTQKFTLAAAPVVGKEYRLAAKINYHNSEENFITFVVGEKAKTGDTQNTLLARLAKQMADNMASAVNTNTNASGTDTIISGTTAGKNKYFTFAVAANALTISEKDWILEDFRVGLRTQDQLMFNFEVMGDDEVMANVTKTSTAPVFATGQGYQIIELERYLVGHRAETGDLLDSTLGFNRKYDTDVSGAYYVLDLKYFDISRDDPKHSDKMLTLASKDPAVIDTIGKKIESLMGGTLGSIFTVVTPAG